MDSWGFLKHIYVIWGWTFGKQKHGAMYQNWLLQSPHMGYKITFEKKEFNLWMWQEWQQGGFQVGQRHIDALPSF
jgi:hypothetical protein